QRLDRDQIAVFRVAADIRRDGEALELPAVDRIDPAAAAGKTTEYADQRRRLAADDLDDAGGMDRVGFAPALGDAGEHQIADSGSGFAGVARLRHDKFRRLAMGF